MWVRPGSRAGSSNKKKMKNLSEK